MSKSWKQLTEKEFELIKTLQKTGVSNKQIASITERAAGTISRIASHNTLQEYRDAQREERYAYNSKVAPTETVEETAEATKTSVPQMSVSAAMNYTDVQLTRMADALERLADAWENTPKKKGWIK